MKHSIVLLFIITIALLSGCASVPESTFQPKTINNNPSIKALASTTLDVQFFEENYVDGQLQGIIPLKNKPGHKKSGFDKVRNYTKGYIANVLGSSGVLVTDNNADFDIHISITRRGNTAPIYGAKMSRYHLALESSVTYVAYMNFDVRVNVTSNGNVLYDHTFDARTENTFKANKLDPEFWPLLLKKLHGYYYDQIEVVVEKFVNEVAAVLAEIPSKVRS